MGIIRNLNKITGRRVNAVIERGMAVTGRMHLRKEAAYVSDDRISYVRMDGSGSPILGAEADGYIDLSRMKGIFSDGEEFDVSAENGRLTFRDRKNRYWFPVTDERYDIPRIAAFSDTELDSSFTVDASEISDIYSAKTKDGYVRFVTGYGKGKERTVRLFLYDGSGDFIDGKDLHTSWEGTESCVEVPVRYVRHIGKLGDNVSVRIAPGYPLVAESKDIVDTRYLIAPCIPDSSQSEYERKKEREWIENHNMRRRR